MQYHSIPCNTMQYHLSLITADRAYYCPVGSIRPFFNILREVVVFSFVPCLIASINKCKFFSHIYTFPLRLRDRRGSCRRPRIWWTPRRWGLPSIRGQKTEYPPGIWYWTWDMAYSEHPEYGACPVLGVRGLGIRLGEQWYSWDFNILYFWFIRGAW